MSDQDLGPRSKKTKYKTEYNVQVAKGYICSVKYQREKHIESTLTKFENQDPIKHKSLLHNKNAFPLNPYSKLVLFTRQVIFHWDTCCFCD